jgi:hypothetical protein
MKIEIINPIESPRWKQVPCHCNHDSVETEYPIAKCLHCESEDIESRIPTESFTRECWNAEEETAETKTCNKIELFYNKKTQAVTGWREIYG